MLEDKNSGFCLHFIETISILYVLQFSKSGVLWRIGKNEIVCKCLYDSGAGFTTLFYQGWHHFLLNSDSIVLHPSFLRGKLKNLIQYGIVHRRIHSWYSK